VMIGRDAWWTVMYGGRRGDKLPSKRAPTQGSNREEGNLSGRDVNNCCDGYQSKDKVNEAEQHGVQ
jgi:hypothetical protein